MRAAERVAFRSGPQIDMPLLAAIVLISCLGVVNLYSASSVYLGAAQRGGLADLYVSQIYWIVVGFLFAIFVAAVDYRHFERLALVLYLGGLTALVLVFVLGADIRGSVRWLQVGTFNFQPSEFMKILVILVVARYLHNDPKTEPRTLVDLAVPLGLTIVPVIAVMAQPDLGTSMVYLLTTASMLAITKVRRRSVLTAAAMASGGAYLAWRYTLKDYQLDRITSFIDPGADRTGAGWHAFQSQTAIGNGRLTGEGFMQGTQNQFGLLPDQHSDFPFSVFAEEWGFVGSLFLLGLYYFVSIWAIHLASQAKDRFGAAVAIGVGAMFFWHTIFNIGMAVGVLPVVGITLPLFSYGGSSVLTILIGLGLLMGVSMRR